MSEKILWNPARVEANCKLQLKITTKDRQRTSSNIWELVRFKLTHLNPAHTFSTPWRPYDFPMFLGSRERVYLNYRTSSFLCVFWMPEKILWNPPRVETNCKLQLKISTEDWWLTSYSIWDVVRFKLNICFQCILSLPAENKTFRFSDVFRVQGKGALGTNELMVQWIWDTQTKPQRHTWMIFVNCVTFLTLKNPTYFKNQNNPSCIDFVFNKPN